MAGDRRQPTSEQNRDFTRALAKQIWLECHVNLLPFAVCEGVFKVYMQQVIRVTNIYFAKIQGKHQAVQSPTWLQKDFTYSFCKKNLREQ